MASAQVLANREHQRRHYERHVKGDPARCEHHAMMVAVNRYRREGKTPHPWSKIVRYCQDRELDANEVIAGRHVLPVPK
jgi:hypothetical protein